MYDNNNNNIVYFQESTTILNACTKKSLETYWEAPRISWNVIYKYIWDVWLT